MRKMFPLAVLWVAGQQAFFGYISLLVYVITQHKDEKIQGVDRKSWTRMVKFGNLVLTNFDFLSSLIQWNIPPWKRYFIDWYQLSFKSLNESNFTETAVSEVMKTWSSCRFYITVETGRECSIGNLLLSGSLWIRVSILFMSIFWYW